MFVPVYQSDWHISKRTDRHTGYMVGNSTDAQPVCLLLRDDYLLCFLLIVKLCAARKLRLPYARYLVLVRIGRFMNYAANVLPTCQGANLCTPPGSRHRLPFNPSAGQMPHAP